MLKTFLFTSTLLFVLIVSGCATEAQYIFYKTGVSEEDFGPYTRARLECRE